MDLLRVIAISMIVLMHSPRPEGNAPGYILSSISYLTVAGLVLFFVISGSLLLNNNLSTKEFIKRRFSKIVWPTLFWTLFYMAVKTINGTPMPSTPLKRFLSIPFTNQGLGVLWFMYALAGLYLLTPILSQWLKKASKREVEFYLALWTVTLLYPYLSQFITITAGKNGILYYFSGYVGYYVLGYYLSKHYIFRLWHVALALALAVLIPVGLYSSGKEFDFYTMLWSHTLPVASMAFAIYVLINQLPNKHIRWIELVSKMSFGIYFLHIFFMRDIIWKIELVTNLPDVIQIFVIAFTTLVVSFLVSWLISKLPFSKYIIGV